MAVRTSLQLGLTRRALVGEAALALVSGASIAVGSAAPQAPVLPVPAWTFAVATALLPVLVFLFRRTAPTAPFLLGAVLMALSPAVQIAALITSYAVGRYVRRWRVRALAAVVGVVAIAQPWAVDSVQLLLGALIGAAVLVLLPGAVGATVQSHADLMTALRERAERAEAERELLAREAIVAERARIAREMHDAVGHRVSLMVLQAGAIEMAATDRDRVEELACQVQAAGRQALAELRQAVGVLRTGEPHDDAPLSPQPGIEDLQRLVKESRSAGMAVEFAPPPDDVLPPDDAAPLDPAVSRAAYRIVQEALTNAGKHAPGAHVTVTLERPPGQIVVRVVNGSATEPVREDAGGGYGLVGLRERVRTLHGTLRAEPRLDGGFVVEAVIPA